MSNFVSSESEDLFIHDGKAVAPYNVQNPTHNQRFVVDSPQSLRFSNHRLVSFVNPN